MLESFMPEKMQRNLAQLMSAIAPEGTPFDPDVEKLAPTDKAVNCNAVMQLIDKAGPYYSGLVMTHTKLNSTAKALPALIERTLQPSTGPIMEKYLELAYVETLGLREAAGDIVKNLGPVLAERLHCGFTSMGAPRNS